MCRVKLAFCILCLLIAISALGHVTMNRITSDLTTQLTDIRAQTQAGDYTSAAQSIENLLAYYETSGCLLELLIKRETVAALHVSLSGMSAYANEQTAHDLLSETNKALRQVESLHHLFFSFF